MTKLLQGVKLPLLTLLFLSIASCVQIKKNPPTELVNSINLKRGEIVECGSTEKQFGAVAFPTSCSEKVKKDFDLAIALLHSFEYDEAEKVFAKIIDEEPQCAMAYWGVAMSNYHLLWTPPSAVELTKGSKAIEIAKGLTHKSKQEIEYINAAAELYND